MQIQINMLYYIKIYRYVFTLWVYI